MRITKIEPIAIRVPTRKMDPDAWAQTQKSTGWSYTIHPNTWDKVPMERFATVVLRYTLNHAKDLEDMRSMVSDALDRVHDGGKVVALARACDNGQELAERMVQSGIKPDDLGISNISNREIGRLMPNSAVLLTNSSVFRPADSELSGEEVTLETTRFYDWAVQIRQSPVLPELRFQPEKMAVRITDVGLLWRK